MHIWPAAFIINQNCPEACSAQGVCAEVCAVYIYIYMWFQDGVCVEVCAKHFRCSGCPVPGQPPFNWLHCFMEYILRASCTSCTQVLIDFRLLLLGFPYELRLGGCAQVPWEALLGYAPGMRRSLFGSLAKEPWRAFAFVRRCIAFCKLYIGFVRLCIGSTKKSNH